MIIFLIILSILSISVHSAPTCSEIDNLDDNQLWNELKPNIFQLYFTIILGSLSVIGLIFTLWTWRLYKSFSIPTDIMFAICWAELFENFSLLSSTIFSLVHKDDATIPPNFDVSCSAIGIIFALGNTGSLIYNMLFCIVLSFSIKKTLKGSMFNQFRYHLAVLIIVVAITISLAATQALGSGLTRICGYKIQNRQSFARFISQLIVISICLFSMYSFKAKVPKNQYFKKVSVFGYYYYYMGIFCFVQLVSTVCYIVGNIACRTNSSVSSDIIEISITVGSCQSIFLSFFILFLRFSHPAVKLKLKKIFKCKKQEQQEIILQNQIEDQQEMWLGSLLQSIKASQIISFLTSILVSFSEHEHKIQTNIKTINFNKNYVIQLNESVTDEYIMRRISNRESLIANQKLDGLRPLEYKVTIFAMEVFAEMISQQTDLNIFHSFNIVSNINLVKQKSYTNGGKSGQFFFCTYDHKFLIKTITEDEAELYLSKMNEFFQYFQQNPHTMISKIYCLLKFERSDVKQPPIYLMMMKNISPYDRKLQERVYDIKGSQFNRSTMKQKNIQNVDKLRSHTLKDLDFKKLQRRICIDPTKSKKLKSQLKRDAEFLGKMDVIDYSVLIIKRKGKMREKNNQEETYAHNQFPSYAEKDMYYNIGIIDYLESWTLKRKAERAFKTMITKKKVTVTSPEEYSKRLSQFIEQII